MAAYVNLPIEQSITFWGSDYTLVGIISDLSLLIGPQMNILPEESRAIPPSLQSIFLIFFRIGFFTGSTCIS